MKLSFPILPFKYFYIIIAAFFFILLSRLLSFKYLTILIIILAASFFSLVLYICQLSLLANKNDLTRDYILEIAISSFFFLASSFNFFFIFIWAFVGFTLKCFGSATTTLVVSSYSTGSVIVFVLVYSCRDFETSVIF